MATIEPIELTAITVADVDASWHALTEPERVAEWFAKVDPAGPAGSPYRIDFGDGSLVEGTVKILEPGRRLAYTWAWAGEEDDTSGGTVVTWTLEPEPDGRTRITLVHSGWAEAGADEATRDDHATYWEMYLDDLVELLDGQGAQDPVGG